MADETKNQQGGQSNYGSQQGGKQGQHDQTQQNQPGQSGQYGQGGQQKNTDPDKKNPSTGGMQDDEDDQNRDRQRRAS
jgi:hypothetical protein